MTTSPVMSITDELLAELEAATEYQHCDLPGSTIRALLAHIADLKQQVVAVGITAENCELFRRKTERPNIEAAAKMLAACMDYPWQYMPEQGRNEMRKHAQSVIDAAMEATQ